MATDNTTLPPGIEAFRSGRHTDDQGNVHEFTDAQIEEIAAGYNPDLREAPLVVGHPAANLPAYGWVTAVRSAPGAAGKVLQIDSRDVEPAFAEMVRLRRFPKRSASFYPPNHPGNPTPGKWYLRHVGFLGAQPPAVHGLKEIPQFSEPADGAVNFSEPLPDTPGHVLSHPLLIRQEQKMDEETKKELAATKARAEAAEQALADAEARAKGFKDQLAQFSEAQRADRHAAHVSFAEGAVKAGKLLPINQAGAVAVLDTLAEIQPVEFAEGGTTKKLSPAEFIKGLIDNAKPIVQFGEFSPGGGSNPARAMTDAELDQAAKQYAAKHNVNYAEALDRVVSFSG